MADTVKEDGKDVIKKSIKYLSYKEVQQKIGQLASSVNEKGIAPQIEEVPGMKMRFLGVYTKNRAEWLLVDLTCIMYGFVLVPM